MVPPSFVVSECFDIDAIHTGDSDVILMPASFRRHLVKYLLYCNVAEMRFVVNVKLVIIHMFL